MRIKRKRIMFKNNKGGKTGLKKRVKGKGMRERRMRREMSIKRKLKGVIC